jgi:hypothetical protein
MGLADLVISEDSDIIVYAALCPRPFPIFFKMSHNGVGQELVFDPLTLAAQKGKRYDGVSLMGGPPQELIYGKKEFVRWNGTFNVSSYNTGGGCRALHEPGPPLW